MKLVVDANILFAVLIKDSITAKLILNEQLELFSPEFIFEEFGKYQALILNKTKRSAKEFEEILSILKELINIVSGDELIDFLGEAEKFSPDPNDVAYFALALKLDIPIWSNDKLLKNQDRVKIINTKELIRFQILDL